MLLAVGTIDAYVRGRVLDQLAEQEAIRRSGFSQEQWLERMGPWMTGIMCLPNRQPSKQTQICTRV